MPIRINITPNWSLACWVLAFIFIAGAIQLSIPYPVDGDTAYHAAVGQLISQHGILYSFPWTPYSWLADHYADKELLFHLLFVPLIRLDLSWTNAAQIVGTLGGSAVLLSMYFILRAESAKVPWLWALVPLAVSFEFIYRFVLVRPFLFSIALALVVSWSAVRGRLPVLALASAFYPWAYVAWHLPVILVCIVEAARFMSAEPVRYKPLMTSIAGIAAGLLLHPNSLNLVRMTWLEMVNVLFKNAWNEKVGIEMGFELSRTPLSVWGYCLLLTVVLALAAFHLAWRRRRDDPAAFAFALTTMAFFVLTIKTYKFVEYFVPFSVAAAALATRTKPWRFLPHMVMLAAIVYTLSLNYSGIYKLTKRQSDMPPASRSFLQQMIPPGALVFSPDWDLTGVQMLALPERRFIVALNPSYFYEKDPELYQIWFKASRGEIANSADVIRKRFNTRFVLCTNTPEWQMFLRDLAQTPGVKSYITDNLWVLFDLGGPDRS